MYPLPSSKGPLDSERKGLRYSFTFFRKYFHRQTNEWTKQLIRLENWVIVGSPEQSMESYVCIDRLLYLIISFCFSFFSSICCLGEVSGFCFFWTFVSLYLFLKNLRKKNSSTTTRWSNASKINLICNFFQHIAEVHSRLSDRCTISWVSNLVE